MIIEDSFEQRSDLWFRAKAGVPGASSFDKIIAPSGVSSKSAKEYAYQLAGEKLLGRIEEGYVSFAMQQGIEREDEARQAYEIITGNEVRQVALVYKNESKNVACSPDGLLENKGLEIKCPILKTHVKYMLFSDALAKEYFCQVQGSMWVCGLSEWDLMSYYPGMPPVISTIERDDNFISKLESEMISFLRFLNEIHSKLAEARDA